MHRRRWDEAFARDRPVVLEVRTDPSVPLLPPHINLLAKLLHTDKA